MSLQHVVDHVFVVRACFITGCPASISELDSAFADKLLDSFLDRLVLPRIPHVEVLDLSESDSSFRVLHKSEVAPREDDLNIGDVSPLIGSRIILFQRLLPA